MTFFAELIDEIEAELQSTSNNRAEQEAQAAWLLNRTGCRIWIENGTTIIGFWPDLDDSELRAALAMDGDHIERRALDGNDVPEDYRERLVPLRSPDESLLDWLERTSPEVIV